MQISSNACTWNSVKSIESSEYESGPLADPAKNHVLFWNLLLALMNLRGQFPQHYSSVNSERLRNYSKMLATDTFRFEVTFACNLPACVVRSVG
jgi:hypothetical protein